MLQSYSWIWDNYYTRSAINVPTGLYQSMKPKGCGAAKEIVTKGAHTVMIMHIPSYSRWFVRLAGLSGAAAVALGAYGAHAFYQRETSEDLKQVYETANRYHFIHTLALLGIPLCRRPKIAGTLIAVGTLIFSGTCYYYALTGSRSVRQYTPYGGMLLIFGWLAMVL